MREIQAEEDDIRRRLQAAEEARARGPGEPEAEPARAPARAEPARAEPAEPSPEERAKAEERHKERARIDSLKILFKHPSDEHLAQLERVADRPVMGDLHKHAQEARNNPVVAIGDLAQMKFEESKEGIQLIKDDGRTYTLGAKHIRISKIRLKNKKDYVRDLFPGLSDEERADITKLSLANIKKRIAKQRKYDKFLGHMLKSGKVEIEEDDIRKFNLQESRGEVEAGLMNRAREIGVLWGARNVKATNLIMHRNMLQALEADPGLLEYAQATEDPGLMKWAEEKHKEHTKRRQQEAEARNARLLAVRDREVPINDVEGHTQKLEDLEALRKHFPWKIDALLK